MTPVRQRHRGGLRGLAIAVWATAILLGPAILRATTGAGPETASVSGRILAPTGVPLSNAAVEVERSSLSTTSDRSGFYRLTQVPIGQQTLIVSYLGYQPRSLTVTLGPGEVVERDVTLAFGEVVTVRSGALTGQAKALNQRKNAVNIVEVLASDHIGRFPDANAAEAVQRISGVNLQRSQGEGRYALVRTTEARFTSTSLDGESLPSPESEGERRVPLDIIPADLLEAIEVFKALTPDMDGDAIGGRINLVTRRAPERLRLLATIAGGYNEIVEDSIARASFSFGRRFGGDGRTGWLGTGSWLETQRGSDNIEPEYDGGFLDTLELRDYTIRRRRGGWTGALDHRFSDRASVFLRGMGNDFDDDEIRRRKRQRISRNRIERDLRHRPRRQSIRSLTGGGNLGIGTSLLVDYRLAWNRSREEIRDRTDSNFVQRGVVFDPNVGPDLIDPDNIRARPRNEDVSRFLLDRLESRRTFAREQDVAGSLDVTIPFYRSESRTGYWKAGFKYRHKEKSSDTDRFRFDVGEIPLLDLLSDFESQTPFFDGRYDIGPFQSLAETGRLTRELSSTKDIGTDIEDFTTREDVLAGYGMAELALDNLTLLGGFRFESTATDSEAFEWVDGDDFLTPIAASKRYDELLPMFHLRYRLTPERHLRAAVTRTLARPDFVDLIPTVFEDLEDLERQRGNPDLNVTSAWSFDLLYESFLEPVGVVSAGLFYKRMEDNIFIRRFEEIDGGAVFEVSQPSNGRSSEILGLEVAFQNQLHHLPAPFDGLGLYFNYTYSDSAADFLPGRPGTRLPNQAKHLGNLALSFENGGFAARLSFNYRSESIRALGDSAARDVFHDDHFQVDFSAGLQLTDRLRLSLELVNLGDEPLRRYEGSPERPIQEELYSWWGTLGLQWDL